MIAASRAITEAARERRLQLVKSYLDHLHALGEPWPFPEDWRPGHTGSDLDRSAFGWDTKARKDYAPEVTKQPLR